MRALEYDYLKTYVRTSALVKAMAADAAHRFGIPVGTHLMSPGFYAGVDQTAHLAATQRLGYPRTVTDNTANSYKDVIGAYAKRSMMTTLGGFDVLSDHVCPGTDPRLLQRELEAWPVKPRQPDLDCQTSDCKHSRTMKRVQDAGGIMMTGTDFPLGSDVFMMLQSELRVLVQYGYWTPYEALRASFHAPAKFLSIDDDLGSLEPGKLADIIFRGGQPAAEHHDVSRE